MKLELHRFFQRKEISNLVTAIANTKVDGMKVRAKSFLKALAILSEESNYKDFLNNIDAKHQEAFSNIYRITHLTVGIFRLEP